jgi:tetratricopeptide (TPR) repeat protein
MMLGVVYRKKREYGRAAAYLQQLLMRAQAQGNKGAEATTAHHLAWVYLNQGNVSEARRLCGQAITLYDEIGDLRGASDAFEQLGLVALAGGENNEALIHLKRSLHVRQELGNRHGAASSLRHLALAYLRMGHLGAAVSHLWQSLWTYHRLGVLSRQRWLAICREFWDWTIGHRRWTV